MYIMSIVLNLLINKQFMVTGIMSGNILGSFIVFFVILIICFFIALFIALLFKCFYFIVCKIFKRNAKEIFSKVFWYIFTVLCYISVFIIFLKMIEY